MCCCYAAVVIVVVVVVGVVADVFVVAVFSFFPFGVIPDVVFAVELFVVDVVVDDVVTMCAWLVLELVGCDCVFLGGDLFLRVCVLGGWVVTSWVFVYLFCLYRFFIVFLGIVGNV